MIISGKALGLLGSFIVVLVFCWEVVQSFEGGKEKFHPSVTAMKIFELKIQNSGLDGCSS
jgi:hypothetical protein